jgi:hypothetical protein
MSYGEFLEHVINEGIKSVERDYTGTSERQQDKKDGSIAGFEACRGKAPDELIKEFEKATKLQQEAYILQVDNYWWFRCYTAEVEWVINVISAATGRRLLPFLPTAAGIIRANEIMKLKNL